MPMWRYIQKVFEIKHLFPDMKKHYIIAKKMAGCFLKVFQYKKMLNENFA